MNDWEKKRKFRAFIFSKVSLCLLVLVLGSALRGTWNLYYKSKEAEINKARVAYELSELTKRQDFLKKELTRLNTPLGKESVIREKYNVKKEGEEVVVVLPKEKQKAEVSASGIRNKMSHFFGDFVDFFR